MPERTLRRRRPSSSARADDNASTTSSAVTHSEPASTASPAAAGADNAAEEQRPKTIVELIDEEEKSYSQFLSLVGLVVLIFLYMIRSTELPPPHRVTAVVIDAGSTGTRAQVFHFMHDAETNRLNLNRTQMFQHKAALAALAVGTTSTSPAKFFRPVLEDAKKGVVGMRRRKRTPIILRATAGLRLLGADAADNALEKARTALNGSEFLFRDEFASVLDPADEARFGWVSVNYLLGNLAVDALPSNLVGTLEMGGASMQVVYSLPPDDAAAAAAVPAGEKHTVSLFGTRHILHARSYLGLGLLDSMRRLYSIFDTEGVLEEGNPCFRLGKTFKDKSLRMGVAGADKTVRVTIEGDGNFDRCVASNDIAIGAAGPANTLPDKKGALPAGSTFYAFAYFFDRIIGLGLPKQPTRAQLIARGEELCETSPDKHVPGDFDEACAEFSYVFAVLKILTDDFSKERNVKVIFEQYIDGHMMGWALAAALDAVEPTVQSQLSLDTDPMIMP